MTSVKAGINVMIQTDLIYIPMLMAGLLLPAAGLGQALPEAEGRDQMLVACTKCHGLDNIISPHKELSAEEWEMYVYDMISRGAYIPTDDIDKVIRYLIDNFVELLL
jgi:hypothetical protein